MASKKYAFILGLISLYSSAAFSQMQSDAGYDWRDSSKISTKLLPQQSEFLNNQYPYPAKPRDMMEFGIHGGLAMILGDVSPNAGIGGGISLRKSLGHTFSVRAQYTGSFNRGVDYKLRAPSTIPGNATPNPWAAFGNNGFVANYKNGVHQGTVEMIAVLNNSSYYRGNPKTNLYAFAGYSIMSADVDVITGPNKRPPANFFNGISFIGKRKDIKEAVKTRLGGDLNYSKEGVNAPVVNGNRNNAGLIDDNQLLRHGLTGGAGLALKLSTKFNIALEQRFTTAFDDNMDGISAGKSSDIFTYTSIRLNFNLGNSSKKVQPLWWINPNNFVYNEINRPSHMKLPTPVLPDADGDGVTDQFDMEPNTPAGVPVDVRGVAKDSDGDGVPDYKDKELLTSQKCFPVDADGVGNCPEPACCTELRNRIDSGMVGNRGTACAISSLPSVQFRAGSASLSRDAQAILSSAADQIKSNPTCKIRVTGHGASDKRAQQLSWDRVNAVIRYMVERQGIAEDRFIFDYGTEGDGNTVDLMGTTDEGPNSVPAPHPNLKKG